MPVKDLTGRTYGRLTVIEQAGRTPDRSVRWLCECECGSKKTVVSRQLQSGDTKSCGCLRRDTMVWKMSGKNHPGYRGGEFTFGSPAWAGRLLKCAQRVASKKGYKPPSITEKEYQKLAEGWSGVCPLCEKHIERCPCLDHCHTTGEVRGLICKACNSTLGRYGDEIRKFRNIISYLKGHKLL